MNQSKAIQSQINVLTARIKQLSDTTYFTAEQIKKFTEEYEAQIQALKNEVQSNTQEI